MKHNLLGLFCQVKFYNKHGAELPGILSRLNVKAIVE
jgi:hypothetical protein